MTASAARRIDRILDRLEHFGVKLGLDRVTSLLAALGNPERDSHVVLVGGTNGKGSTSALLASMARAAGYRAGVFNSPHLEDVRERITIDGRPLDPDLLADYLEDGVRRAEAIQGDAPTYFESLTIAAFRAFRDAGVDLAIMEVGLGGRLDATNVCEPALSLITSIGLDHMRLLGDTPAAIAAEKAGIFRADRPAIAWAGSSEVARALGERADTLGTDLRFADEHVTLTPRSAPGVLPQSAIVETPIRRYALELTLAGAHQLRNAAVAVLGAEALAEQGFDRLGEAAIVTGAGRARWPGRLEWVALPDDRHVLLDGAHNRDGADALAHHLSTLPEPPTLLFGALAAKPIEHMLRTLAPRVGTIVLTEAPGTRAGSPAEWLPFVTENKPVIVEPDRGKALEVAIAHTSGALVVCGSLYLIGEIRPLLRDRFGVPTATVASQPFPVPSPFS